MEQVRLQVEIWQVALFDRNLDDLVSVRRLAEPEDRIIDNRAPLEGEK